MPRGRPPGIKETKPRNTVARKQCLDFSEGALSPLDGIKLAALEAFEDWQNQERHSPMRAVCRAQYVAVMEKAAPYCHAKLTAVDMTANVRRSVADFSDEELAVIAGEESGEG